MIALVDGARSFGIELTAAQDVAFEAYYRELIDWNARVNLTSITERDQVMVKHFLDSLSAAPVIASRVAAKPSPHLIDIGAGAGLPGIPLKIVFPDLQLTLLETTGKKVDFLKHMIAQLKLENALAIQARAEDLGHDAAHRERYDVAVARAIAPMVTLAEYTLPLVCIGGMFIAYKGVDVDAEMQAASRAIEKLGGRVRKIVPVQLPGLEPRHLIVVEKTSATPEKFPRRAPLPKQKPIS
jgi:16S rRNA (guanine527-N7)-methyltransferase